MNIRAKVNFRTLTFFLQENILQLLKHYKTTILLGRRKFNKHKCKTSKVRRNKVLKEGNANRNTSKLRRRLYVSPSCCFSAGIFFVEYKLFQRLTRLTNYLKTASAKEILYTDGHHSFAEMFTITLPLGITHKWANS